VPTTNPLMESGQATIGADGKATVRLQPLRAHETWRIRRIQVQSTSTILVPTCRIYKGAVAANLQVDGTQRGTMDHSDTDLPLLNGEAFIAVWESGDVGALCVVTIEGERSR
jgi:hypothetical protein